MITEFLFVRHGETDANLNGILQGQLDIKLNATGLAQAEAVAEYLRNEPLDVIFVSDLSRAVMTAEKIAAAGHADVPVIQCRELREIACGELEGKSMEFLREKYSEKMAIFYREKGGCFPGGESKDGFQSRISAVLEQLRREYRGKKILIVSHGGVQQRIFSHICGSVKAGNMLPLAGNASISGFRYSENMQAWQMTFWNFREHLKNLPQHQTLVV